MLRLFQRKQGPKKASVEERPKNIQEAIERGLIKDIYLHGINTATIGGNVEGGITNVVLEEWDCHAKPGVLIQGHTFVTFPRTTRGYLNGRPTELRNGDYVRLYDGNSPQ